MSAGKALGTDLFDNLTQSLSGTLARSSVQVVGRVAEAYGTLIRVTGLHVRIGDMCLLRNPNSSWELQAEVVGLSKAQALLAPLGGLEGISQATEVIACDRRSEVNVSRAVLGRVLNAHGDPIDEKGSIPTGTAVPVYNEPPPPLKRSLIHKSFGSGVRAIDSVLTCGEGQRVGIFAVAGAGKSTLLGMLARGSSADINVIALIGERGREVREFITDSLGEAGMKKSVVVVSTSDRPSMERAKAAYVATAIAEYFRDEGQRVMLLFDSVTRFARALRDVGLSIGEPPARRGYPPSVFTALPLLFERTGNNEKGSITAFYSVLVEEEDAADPIGEEVRSILDGHVYLSRKLASANHYPAIDVLSSASRLMSRVAAPSHIEQAGLLRKYLSKYQEIELLLQLGEYKPGGDPEADQAVKRIAVIRKLLQQDPREITRFEDAVSGLRSAVL
jgi:ATP synthase in type III secretion protein N